MKRCPYFKQTEEYSYLTTLMYQLAGYQDIETCRKAAGTHPGPRSLNQDYCVHCTLVTSVPNSQSRWASCPDANAVILVAKPTRRAGVWQNKNGLLLRTDQRNTPETFIRRRTEIMIWWTVQAAVTDARIDIPRHSWSPDFYSLSCNQASVVYPATNSYVEVLKPDMTRYASPM